MTTKMEVGQAFAFKRQDSKSNSMWHAARVEEVTTEDGETRVYFTAVAMGDDSGKTLYRSYLRFVPGEQSGKRWQLPAEEHNKYRYEFRTRRDGWRVQAGPPAVTTVVVADSVTDGELVVWEAALRLDHLRAVEMLELRYLSAQEARAIVLDGLCRQGTMKVRKRNGNHVKGLLAALRTEDGESLVEDAADHVEMMVVLAAEWAGTVEELATMAVMV